MSNAKDNSKLTLKKPVSIWYRELTMPRKTLFTHMAKGAYSAVFLDGKGVQNNLLDIGKDMGLKEDKAQIAWRLVMLSFTQALTDILDDYRDLFDEKLVDSKIEEAARQFEAAVEELQMEIDADFFKKPQDVAFLNDIESAVCFWLEASGLETDSLDARTAKNLYARVKQRFVFCLHNEWLNSPSDYAVLEDCFDSPFSTANQEQIAWARYNNWLIEQPKARLFAESFGLDKVYVPLRAYFKVEKEKVRDSDSIQNEDKVEKHVVDLHSNMHQWLSNFDSKKALRIIAGGPGSGKSTFAKVFAAEVAERHSDIKVILVPLQHFSVESDVVNALENFIKKERFLTGSPLSGDVGEKRLLLIFDGLDELASLGRVAEESARDFIVALDRELEFGNRDDWQRQAVVTSRDITAQSCATSFRNPGQYLQVLPYYLNSNETGNFSDSENLLAEDQRDLWWQSYSLAKGLKLEGLPKVLAGDSLEPITKEPLLNYLVALSYESKGDKIARDTTLNEIYEDLLKAVHSRKYARNQNVDLKETELQEAGGGHDAIRNMDFKKFTMVLESIAIAVWHGHGRTASEKTIAEYCEKRELSEHLEEYKQGNKKGLNRLLTAFYFRESDQGNMDQKTFEFTHKSFGEYLIARRVFKDLQAHHKQLQRRKDDPEDGKDILTVLKEWAELCGPTAIDNYLNSFIEKEAKLAHINAAELQKTLASLLSHVIRRSLPMEKVGLSNFNQMLNHARNAEEALLVMHSACARCTDEVSTLHFDSNTAFGTWLRRVSPQRDSAVNVTAMQSLNHLDLAHCHFEVADLYACNLKNSRLVEVAFLLATMVRANLRDANLRDADLRSAKLQDADLRSAKLLEAGLQSADLRNADLRNADLRNADLQEADLRSANLTGADLRDADLRGADLRGAVLRGADLRDAKLQDADLNDVNISVARVNLRNKETVDLFWQSIHGYDEIIWVDDYE